MMSTANLPADRPVRVAVVGAGKRAWVYTKHALSRPDRMKLVAIADPHPERRDALGDVHGVPVEHRFARHDDLVANPSIADAIINTTGDSMHYASALPLIRAGYHMLLEKPIALCEAQVRELIAATQQSGRVVMICHVMRYLPFYQKVRELVDSGAIGRLRSLHASENVAYHHLATTFIRSARYAGVTPTPMLMQKCCHDMDLIAWLAGAPARRVSSFATPSDFVPANAPAGSTERCLNGCAVEQTCAYSARKLYVENHSWDTYPWPEARHGSAPSDEHKLQSLRNDNPYGRCVWRCDHTAVGHQNVGVEFVNGVSASFDLFCASARGYRTLKLVGTAGEILGDGDAGWLTLRRLGGPPGTLYTEETLNLPPTEGGHSGADQRLVEDFVAVLRGEPGAQGLTRIEDSLTGHQIVFAADAAQRERRVVEI